MHDKTKEFIQQIWSIKQLFVTKEELVRRFHNNESIEQYLKHAELYDGHFNDIKIHLAQEEQNIEHNHFLVHVRFRDSYWERNFRRIKRTFNSLEQRTKEKDIFMDLMKKNIPENMFKDSKEIPWYLDRPWYSVAESDRRKEPISSIKYDIEICRLDYRLDDGYTGFKLSDISRKGRISMCDNIDVIMNHKEFEKYLR
ncbi:MAG: hypothetical protein KKF46_08000 [Nanoarchaeota archaeon]|nr:hypothetical protein [Nanoarchaeota archaeon]MBU1322270.1 hypothetical protein [Nanoarchaeota archaeon]MBU1598023.1 hypothetical protein [Nanoarchaeota archaeon]MBU2441011.1 hypothetical protein [Nanoarchaeota archaeon]